GIVVGARSQGGRSLLGAMRPMPLHDWTDRSGWDGVHSIWLVELLRAVKPQLPPDYRAYLGTAPTVAIDAPIGNPDVHVRRENGNGAIGSAASDGADLEPEVQVVVATLDPTKSLFVELQGRLIAAVEVISPRNKDRPSARANYAGRYLGYLTEG